MLFVRLFQPGDEEAFRALNEAWIAKYFRLEEKDRETLEDPHSHILLPGGQIFMAVRDGQRIGGCALIALKDGSMEVAKMAVAESERGQGIGRKLLDCAITYARAHAVPRLTSKPIALSRTPSGSTNRPASSAFPLSESNLLRMRAPTSTWK
jgi:GNAT superfamily N-acetyltransferase